MLKPLKYQFFAPREIRPEGWLRRQLEIQADGLAGNLDKVWRDVRESAWIGGSCEGWERVPYWLDGFIPLAFLLEDEDRIARAKRYIDAILASQRPDGWLCPCTDAERPTYDTWAVLLIAKVLALWGECSGDERIPDALSRCLKQFSAHINRFTLRKWGAARWFEGLIAIFWLYEKTGEEWLLILARKLRAQGFDWRAIFEGGLLDDMTSGWDFFSHIVAVGMMIKSEALASRFTELDPADFADRVCAWLDEHHGSPAGHWNGDENLHGTSPISGAELCSVMEAMYSCEQLFSITGNPAWLDRLERLAFNSLPATTSPDMWSHQYDQMANQVCCTPMEKQLFRSNGVEAHLFGLEPNYGCCTANMGQGWPKLALSAWMRGGDGSIVSAVLVPSTLKTEVNGVPVEITLDTHYPFGGGLFYHVKAERPVAFTLRIRVPEDSTVTCADGSVKDGFLELTKVWSDEKVAVTVFAKTRMEQRPSGLWCVKRGVLTFALPIAEKWQRVEYTKNGVERTFPYCDYHITPQSEWAFGFADDQPAVSGFTLTDTVFDPANPPIRVLVRLAPVEWDFTNGHCAELPESNRAVGEAHEFTLIPYGCTNLRMTELPMVE